MTTPTVEMRNIEKHFGSVIALAGVSIQINPGEVHCLLGDNGAGKSTFINIMSGVFEPTAGEIFFEGRRVKFSSPRQVINAGIATVYQDLSMIPLMSIARNFFLGREPVKGWWPFRYMDKAMCNAVTRSEMSKLGIDVRDPGQAVGTLSGGERQTVAIGRAVYFGAKVLILDEPTSSLGVRQTAMVLKHIDRVRSKGIGVVFVSHNVRHALAVGDTFTVLDRGRTLATVKSGDIDKKELQSMMAGGRQPRGLDA